MSSKAPIGGSLAVEVQLKGEAASALRHTGSQMEKASAALLALHARLASGVAGAERRVLLEQYRVARAEAEHRKWCLIVQREAMGLWHHDDLDDIYPIPPPLKD